MNKDEDDDIHDYDDDDDEDENDETSSLIIRTLYLGYVLSVNGNRNLLCFLFEGDRGDGDTS